MWTDPSTVHIFTLQLHHYFCFDSSYFVSVLIVSPGWPANDPCRKYKVLNQRNRGKSYTPQNALKCDKSGFATRWYRFTGAAGNKMPNSCVPMRRCSTHASGWMKGAYPRIRGQVVRRKVCFHWSNKCCNWSNYTSVKNCGGYYVFYLTRTPGCTLRYCGNA
jgi:uromodulin